MVKTNYAKLSLGRGILAGECQRRNRNLALAVVFARCAAAPVDDLGLVYFEAVRVTRSKTRDSACRAININEMPTLTADHVMVIVVHSTFKARG